MGMVQGYILRRRTAVALLIVCACVVAGVFLRDVSAPADRAVELPSFPSFYLQPGFVADAFAGVASPGAGSDVRMVLVNHHLLGARLIARALGTIATDDATTVVLIAPDHFSGGIAPATSVIARWPTPFGTIEPATDTITALASMGAVHLAERPFKNEHGITNITMFIGRVLPHARLVPIVVRDDASHDDIERLARAITQRSGPVLVIGSFDFTHDATDAVARANDARTLGILQAGNPSDADRIVVDSKPGIKLLMTAARQWGLRFTVLDMSNSARLLGDMSRTDVTSYITGTWAP